MPPKKMAKSGSKKRKKFRCRNSFGVKIEVCMELGISCKNEETLKGGSVSGRIYAEVKKKSKGWKKKLNDGKSGRSGTFMTEFEEKQRG